MRPDIADWSMNEELLASLIEVVANRNFQARPSTRVRLPRPGQAPPDAEEEENVPMPLPDDLRGFFGDALRYVPAAQA